MHSGTNAGSMLFKWTAMHGGLILLLFLTVVLSLCIGEFNLSVTELWQALTGTDNGIRGEIILNLRLPRILLAIAVGSGLSLAGTILQGVYRNPLVEPYTLGISGGAALGVSLAIVLQAPILIGSLATPLMGFAGALTVAFVLYALNLGTNRFDIQRMLLMGVMISFISSSIMMLLMAISTSDNLHNMMMWMMGSLESDSSLLLTLALGASALSIFMAHLFSSALNALRLGDDKAVHLGVNTALSVRILFIIAAMLTGISVSIAGVIGFVGLVVPHIMRAIFGNDYRFLLGASFWGGAIFLTASDLLARTIIAPHSLPVGVVTGIVGSGVFILLLWKRGGGRG